MPAGVPIPVAHVTPAGDPCPLSGGEAYDDEARELILSEDVLWDLDAAPIAAVPAGPLAATRKTKKPAKGRKRAPRAKDDVDDWEP